MNTKLRKLTNKRIWAYGLFWSWNVIFLAFMLLGFAPTVLPEMLTAVRGGDIPTIFLAYGAVLTLIPVLAVVLGATVLRREPGKLFALGYVVEGPLMLLLALRFFLVRQATPAITLLLLVAAGGILTYLWHLLDKNIEQRGSAAATVRLIGLTLLLVIGLYASLFIAFYALPLSVEGVTSIGGIFRDVWRDLATLNWQDIEWRFVPFAVLGVTLIFYSATLFVLMPVAVTVLCVRAWRQGVQHVLRENGRSGNGRSLAIALPVTIIVLLAAGVWLTNRQPQHTAFALLEETPASIEEAMVLLEREDDIRAGLLNAYLAPQRYVSAVGEVRHVSDMYEWGLGLERETAVRVQNAYEVVARPILYQPVNPDRSAQWNWQNQALRREPQEAAVLYAQFFDEPITEGEKETVVRAARSTWSIDQARAAWQAVDDREIWLARQEVTISEHSDWADVELYEVYQNQTTQRQEVVYYFSLPESAVITGVWLGNSDDRNNRFTYRVAPRGAAQETYQRQVQRRIDPALVEQIGPSQYRLRAFPIEPMQWRWDDDSRRSSLDEGPPLHLWLTYRVMAADGAWPMPYLAKKLNVYWDNNSVRLLNGAPLQADNDTWLPDAIPATTAVTPTAHLVTFPDGRSVLARPATEADQPAPSGSLRLAVVLDRSRSMEKLRNSVNAALAQIGQWGAADVYLTSSPVRGEAPSRTTLGDLDADNIVYYGGQNPAELLPQFAALHSGEAYDAILVLTDGTGYELGKSETAVPMPDAPVWMVHLDGRFPIGYDDDTLAAIQASGGGAVGSVAEAMTRLLSAEGDMVDGYVWQVVDGETVNVPAGAVTHAPTDAFAALAARRIILAEMAANRGQLDDVATLDGLHALAVEHSIITPYSSMIVLVNDAQHRLLDNLEGRADRFDREFEGVGETLQPVTVTGVPEPHEWLLMALAVGMLVWFYRQRRQAEKMVIGNW